MSTGSRKVAPAPPPLFEAMDEEGVTYYIYADEKDVFYNKKMVRIGKWNERDDKVTFKSKKFREEHERQRDALELNKEK